MNDNPVLLHTLPEDHPDRNKPLLGCYYKWKWGVLWIEIKATDTIAKLSFKDIGDVWSNHSFFSWDPFNGR